MPNFLIALIIGSGIGAWIYKTQSWRAAGDWQKAVIPAAMIGFLAFVITLTLLIALF